MAPRVVLFVDYQNVYKGARAAFGELEAPPSRGQIDPLALGQLIVRRRELDCELAQVRVYRGQPDPRRDPRGYEIVASPARGAGYPGSVSSLGRFDTQKTGQGAGQRRRASTSPSPSISS